jgi:hypothetical protein
MIPLFAHAMALGPTIRGVFLKEHVPPCVVLVINDNLYELMFELSYICRTCPYTMFEPYVGCKVVRR